MINTAVEVYMIENINGKHETVHFKEHNAIKMYLNDEFEDYPEHWHTPVEIIFPIENHYMVSCGNVDYHLKEGDILLITPGTLHRISAPKSGMRIIFQVDLSLLNRFQDIDSAISMLAPAKIITPGTMPSIYEDAKKLILEIQRECLGTAPLCDALAFAKIAEFFVLLGRECLCNNLLFDVAPTKHQEYTEKFLNICDYISAHCAEDLTLDDIAGRAGFSKYHFSRLFKQFTGETFYKFLNTKRIAYAQNLLIDPGLSITEIAYLSGFNSISSFVRMFKALTAYTPTAYRQLYHS